MACKDITKLRCVDDIYRAEQVSMGFLPTRSATTLLSTESAAYA
jgi:hypothetical protein